MRIVSPLPDEVNIYFVIEDENGLRVPNSTELTAMAAYLDDETIRPLCDGDGAGPRTRWNTPSP